VVVEFQFVAESEKSKELIEFRYIADFKSICGKECTINAKIFENEFYNGILFGQMLGIDINIPSRIIMSHKL